MFAEGTALLPGPVPADLACLGGALELFQSGSRALRLWGSLQ